MTPTAAFPPFSFILNILRYTSRIRTSTLPLPNMHPPKPLSHQLGLYLHILIETPATTAFLFFPSSTLRAPQPHAGNLQGTAGGGQIDVFVEASGFAANLTLRTNGNKQTVQISSKGEIRGVNITMVKS